MDDNTNDMTTPQEPVAAPAPAVLPPISATVPAEKSKSVGKYVLAGVSAVVGAVLVLGAGVIGYSIGNHDSKNHREATLTVSADRNGQDGGQRGVDPDGDNWGGGNQGGGMMDGQQGNGPMMGGDGQRGVDPDGDNWAGGNQGGGMMGGDLGNGPALGGQQGPGPMMQGNGIQDFLNQLQSGQGLTSDQQQFLDQLKGFVGGMRNQAG